MPSFCCVPNCNQKGYTSLSVEKVSFFNFPKAPLLRKQWIHAIRRDEGKGFVITERTKVCSLHFKSEDLRKSINGQSLYTPQPFVKKNDHFKFRKILHRSQMRTQHVRNLQTENDTKCCLTFSLITPLSSNPSMNRHGILTKKEVLRFLNSLVLFQLVKRREYRPLSKNTQPSVTIKTSREKPRSRSRTD